MKEHGVARSALRVTDEALRAVITGYTRESGVRSLERQMGKLCRKTAMCLVSGESKRVRVAPENLEDFLGVRRYLPPVLEQDPVGVVTRRALLATPCSFICLGSRYRRAICSFSSSV